ncbi:MAG: GTPase Era [Bacteroidales bacterium]|nr:GTPase Era [Bacteroidales bacterium]MDD2425179.1 GTPase Era [Bacteroidales bacterium]MDD3989033.1 GTPase Era [Bacteroidales bacterium]MDD4638776.1 GTPase Era [Bacteroidales bacterium]
MNSEDVNKKHRAGFVNIIGNPNVGKSTIMNAFVGERLSIVTAKAQTTRHRIMGIVNGIDYQIVFSDTPGILKPSYKLQQSMVQVVDTAFQDADIILYVTDVVEKRGKSPEYIEKLNHSSAPVLIVINKIDLTNQQELESIYAEWSTLVPGAEIFPASAKEKFNIDPVFDRVLELLPVSPAWFDKNAFTDRNLRFFASEIIREKIFLNYEKEIPYSSEVVIEQFSEEENLYRIEAVIYVMRDSQKGIIIGNRGASLKKTATQARVDMEAFFQKKVYLQIFVKVNPGWREDIKKLRQFGYIQE